MKTQTAKVFDAHAKEYDAVFTDSSIGKRQRAQVYKHLKPIFLNKSKSVLEINCGTGEDARYFKSLGIKWLPTDISEEMIRITNDKVQDDSGVCLDAKSAVYEFGGQHDIIFSNFGGLNCLDLKQVESLIETAGHMQSKENMFIAVIMPKYCLMEGIYHFFNFKWSKLFRRASRNGLDVNVAGKQVKTYYFRPSQIKKSLQLNGYETSTVKPVAIAVPPSYLSNKFPDGNFFLRIFDTLDKGLCKIGWLSGIADHFIIIAKKK